MPVKNHSGAWKNILVGPLNILRGSSGEKIFEFFFSKWYILAYFIFVANSGAPNIMGPEVAYPFYPTLSMGLALITISDFLVGNLLQWHLWIFFCYYVVIILLLY